MPLDAVRVRQCLQKFDFHALFVQELGWDRHPAGLTVAVDGTTYSLQPIAEKRGFQVFECPTSERGRVPDHPTRSKIERQVAKSAHEHIIIYTDAAKTIQKWQWVRRELGRPLARREYDFFKGHTGELLAQKLQYLAVELDEEERLSLVDVTRRVKQAFDVDRVTKRFYDRFKTEHATFLKFIKGITATADAEWYASVMLNRLMFVYFIQKKGFLDGDPDYLRNRLKLVRQKNGKDKFHSFYRYFLLRLFHEGLGQPPAQRKKDLEAVLGDVPYLNGGLFDVHELERSYPDIHIPDEAFQRLFDFFDAYQWHLDERPLKADNEINPDVLGYIFEKYVNQKQMGAYYTKEDITGYIARNTIIPYLFNAAEKKCAIAFKPDSAVWRLLRWQPDWHAARKMARRLGFKLLDLNNVPLRKLENPKRQVFPEIHLPEIAFTHYLVSVPVLKAHSLSTITAALKNMIGLAPPQYYSGKYGIWRKAVFHNRMQQSISDLVSYRAPDLSLLDASIGLAEFHLGGAPCNPPARKIVAGFDPWEVDRIAASLLGLDWKKIPHLANRPD